MAGKPGRSTRRFRGNVPKGGLLLAVHPGEAGWSLYSRNGTLSEIAELDKPFANLKLVAGPGRAVLGKANYWLGVNVRTGYMINNRDQALMFRYLSDMLDWINRVVQLLTYDESFGQLTAEERGAKVAASTGAVGIPSRENATAEADIGDLLA